jgi:F-type H+-transporting ATPase subunit gamma
METLELLHNKMEGAKELQSVVKTMKAMAASNIGQYEKAVTSLEDYYLTVRLGLLAWLKAEKIDVVQDPREYRQGKERKIVAIVFGSDQGLVGQFNDIVTNYLVQSIRDMPGQKTVWAIGDRVQLLLADAGYPVTKNFLVPQSVNKIASMVSQVLVNAEESREIEQISEFYLFHNQPVSGSGYFPHMERILPLDERWQQSIEQMDWPSRKIPEVAGDITSTLTALIREYLFVSLFKACAESLASENASRLAAMLRAEKNIGDLLEELNHRFHHLRQSAIDEELFDVISGFEALKKDFST